MIDTRRLQRTLDGHRRRAEKLGIPAHDVRAEALLNKSKTDAHGRFLCYENQTVLRFDVEAGHPDKATIGHVFPLSAPKDNHPGHVLENVELESWAHNREQNNKRDTPGISKGKRMAVQKGRAKSEGRYRPIPSPKVSGLSSKSPGYRKQTFGRKKR